MLHIYVVIIVIVTLGLFYHFSSRDSYSNDDLVAKANQADILRAYNDNLSLLDRHLRAVGTSLNSFFRRPQDTAMTIDRLVAKRYIEAQGVSIKVFDRRNQHPTNELCKDLCAYGTRHAIEGAFKGKEALLQSLLAALNYATVTDNNATSVLRALVNVGWVNVVGVQFTRI